MDTVACSVPSIGHGGGTYVFKYIDPSQTLFFFISIPYTQSPNMIFSMPAQNAPNRSKVTFRTLLGNSGKQIPPLRLPIPSIPCPILLLVRQLLRFLPQKLNVRPLDARLFHHPRRALIPYCPEQRDSHRQELMLADESPQTEPVPSQSLRRAQSQRPIIPMLQHKDRKPMVGRAFLGKRREPGEYTLRIPFSLELGQGQGRRRGRDRDIDGQEMASGVKIIGLWTWHIRVDDDDGDEPGSFVEDLHIQSYRVGAQA